MAGLVLNLRPNEKFIINGVVVQNGAKRAQIRIENEDANVLRVRDAIHPKDVNTPVKRAYYIAQLLISCDIDEAEGRRKLARALEDLLGVFRMGEPAERLAKAVESLEECRYYSIICHLKAILPAEEALLDYAHSRHTMGEPLLKQAV